MEVCKKDFTDVYLIVAKNIRKYRKLAKMTQYELAMKTGYSYAYIRRLEAPKCVKSFSLQAICHIANVINVDIGKLFMDENI